MNGSSLILDPRPFTYSPGIGAGTVVGGIVGFAVTGGVAPGAGGAATSRVPTRTTDLPGGYLLKKVSFFATLPFL